MKCIFRIDGLSLMSRNWWDGGITEGTRRQRHRRAALERMLAKSHAMKARVRRLTPPLDIKITRLSMTLRDKRGLYDASNLNGACKHVQDGIADALGIDDGDSRLTWRYDQREGGPAVLVEIKEITPVQSVGQILEKLDIGGGK